MTDFSDHANEDSGSLKAETWGE